MLVVRELVGDLTAEIQRNPTLLVWFSLAWLVVGVVAGMNVPRLRWPRISGATRRRGGPVEMYVGNLAPDVTEQMLRDAFGRYGEVRAARVISTRTARETPKVFGFVTMATVSGAEAAIRGMHHRVLCGRRIVLGEARSRRTHAAHARTERGSDGSFSPAAPT